MNISINHSTKKLAFKREGLFPVVKKVGLLAYELKIPKIWKNPHPVIKKLKLKPYHCPTCSQQQETSPTFITSHWVRKALCKRSRGFWTPKNGGMNYSVLSKWQGQPFKESTWKDQCEVTLMHLKSLQFGYLEDYTASLQRRDGNWFIA